MSGVERTRQFYADLEGKVKNLPQLAIALGLLNECTGQWYVFLVKSTSTDRVEFGGGTTLEHRWFKEFRVETVDAVFTDVDSAIATLLLL